MTQRRPIILAMLLLAAVACGPGSRPEAPRPETTAAVPRPESAVREPARESTVKVQPAPESVKPATRTRARTRPTDLLRRTFPGACGTERRLESFPFVVVYDSCDGVLGYEVWSDSCGTTVRGYQGPVPVLVHFDRQARPLRIYLLDNAETPGYIDIMLRGGLLDRLLRYDPARPDSVDAVTLATSSSHAVIAAVTGAADRLAGAVLPQGRD